MGAVDGKWFVTKASRRFPDFTKLLCQYVSDITQDAEHKFPFTCVVLNFGFPSVLHRDKANDACIWLGDAGPMSVFIGQRAN